MSWSIEERIGEFRPFPAQVVVCKGNTDECLAYVSGEVADRLKDENAKLRELLVGAFEDMDAWQKVIAGSNEWGYGKGCLDHLCKLRDAMQELGMEVVVR